MNGADHYCINYLTHDITSLLHALSQNDFHHSYKPFRKVSE